MALPGLLVDGIVTMTAATPSDGLVKAFDLSAFGMRVMSDIDIAGAQRFSHHDWPPLAMAAPLHITSAQLPSPARERGPECWSGQPGSIVYEAPAVVRFECTARSINAAIGPTADPDLVMRLLVANALPSVLWLRGAYALHASAVRLPGIRKAWAICGPSGSGKSTMARACLAHGASLLADDVVSLTISREGDHAEASSPGISGTGLPGGTWRQEGPHRLFQPVQADRQMKECAMGGVLLIDQTSGCQPPTLERLGNADAFAALLANRHRPHLPALIGARQQVFACAVQLAKALPVWRWARPRGAVEISGQQFEQLLALMTKSGNSA